ncbi:dTMP kinase [PVC group bacterium]|nr:dTMP kinase [PVC group bacterium]
MVISRGKFITFEGCDGCGKTTQASMLAGHLRQSGYAVVETREPGGTTVGEKIRQILLDKSIPDLSHMSELLLFTAARVEHVRTIIKPAIAKGEWVICDRFFDATLAYQGYGLGLDKKMVQDLHKCCLGGFEPDLTVFLERDVVQGLENCRDPDRIEIRMDDFHKRVYEGYQDICLKNPDRVKKIRVKESIEDTQKAVRNLMVANFGAKL